MRKELNNLFNLQNLDFLIYLPGIQLTIDQNNEEEYTVWAIGKFT